MGAGLKVTEACWILYPEYGDFTKSFVLKTVMGRVEEATWRCRELVVTVR